MPVYGEEDALRRCLDRLSRQTYPRDRTDIIVIDNASPHPLASVCEHYENVRCLREERPGAYAARNAGIGAAAGDILAFTDADCLPCEHWLERGVQRLLQEKQCGLIGGRIRVLYNRRRPSMVELFDERAYFRQDWYVSVSRFAMTANMFTTRSVIDAVGAFDAQVKCAGDFEWGRRVHAAGLRLIYADDVVVEHPANGNVIAFMRRAARIMGGFVESGHPLAYRSWKDGVRDIGRVMRRDSSHVDTSGLAQHRCLQLRCMLALERAVFLAEWVRLQKGGISLR